MTSSVLRRAAPVLLSLGIVLAALPGLAGERADEPLVYPLDEKIEGKTYKEWTVAWFRWAFSIPKDRSPILDTTGEYASEGQSGSVWFLGGNFGGVTRRTFTVPAGKPVFSPVLYSIADGKTSPQVPKESMDTASGMVVALDGKSLGDILKNRVNSGTFQFTGLDKEDAVAPHVAGKRTLALNGYWFMLKPLAPGEHTLRIKGAIGSDFELDITYELKVAQRNKR